MNTEVLFERDMLYPTTSLNEPGSVHVKVFNPNNNARIPVLIESKTNHSPVTDLDSILRIMQTDIFDRIFIDVRKNLVLYIKAKPEVLKEFGGKAYILVMFNGDKPVLSGIDSMD